MSIASFDSVSGPAKVRQLPGVSFGPTGSQAVIQ